MVKTKRNNQIKKIMSGHQKDMNKVATPLRGRDNDPSMKPQEKSLQKKEVAASF